MKMITVQEAIARLSIGRTTFYGLAASHRIATIRIGRRRLVLAESVDALIRDGLEESRRSGGF